jgi:hypothetical protein
VRDVGTYNDREGQIHSFIRLPLCGEALHLRLKHYSHQVNTIGDSSIFCSDFVNSRWSQTVLFQTNQGLWTYNRLVARGWESKSVEAQQAEAVETAQKSNPRLSVKEAAVVREKENLRLARNRVLQQMEASTNPRHRKVLQDALADLEKRLSKLE